MKGNATLVQCRITLLWAMAHVLPSTAHADADDARWLVRIPIAVMEAQPPHVAVGDVPDDPQPAQVYDQPTVFAAHQLYYWQSTQPKFAPDHPEWGALHNRMDWHFLPTGRFYYRGQNYDGAVASPAGALRAEWGRYTIENETLYFESDRGETGQMGLLHGRRRLDWGELVFDNVVWALETLSP